MLQREGSEQKGKLPRDRALRMCRGGGRLSGAEGGLRGITGHSRAGGRGPGSASPKENIGEPEADLLRPLVDTPMTSWLLAPARPRSMGGGTWLPGHIQPRLGDACGPAFGHLAEGLPLTSGQLLTRLFQTPPQELCSTPSGRVLAFLSQPRYYGRAKGLGRTHHTGLELQAAQSFPGNLTMPLGSPLLPTKTQDPVLKGIPPRLCARNRTEPGSPRPLACLLCGFGQVT